MDADAIRTVVEDIEYLQTAWNNQVSDPEVRRGSAVLRRLLVDDAYGQAWRAIGLSAQPRIVAVDLSQFVGTGPRARIVLALGGGVRLGGIRMAGYSQANGPQPLPQPSPPLGTDGYPGEREFSLSEYLASEAAVAQGKVATRRDVIKYFANIRGGVHLGQGKRDEDKKLVARMTKFEKRMQVLRRDGLLAELIAIGQALARSPDSLRFVEKGRVSE